MHVFHVLFSVNSCTGVDTSDTAWRQEILGLSKGRLGLRSLYQLAPAAYIASICSAGQRQIFTSVLQLQILILLFHLTRHCKFTPFSQRLWSPKKNYPAHWTLACSICCWKPPPMLTKHNCFLFPHHMHHPGCLFYHHRGWAYILMHRSMKLP